MAEGRSVSLVILIENKVKDLIYQTQRVNLTRSNVGFEVCRIYALLVHQVGKVAGRLEIGKYDIAVVRKKKVIKLVLVSSNARDVEFHSG